jgi:hypothetical protein
VRGIDAKNARNKYENYTCDTSKMYTNNKDGQVFPAKNEPGVFCVNKYITKICLRIHERMDQTGKFSVVLPIFLSFNPKNVSFFLH